MIGYLRGKVKYQTDGYLLVECSGVGYKVEVGKISLSLGVDKDIELYIYTHMRENELRLFGFETPEELSLFEMLIDISGVGPKVAISLLKELGVKKIVSSILEKKASGLKVSGVGLKTADKIVLELHDKLKKKGYVISEREKKQAIIDDELDDRIEEAKAALISLGYSLKDIKAVIANIKDKQGLSDLSSEKLVKYMLSEMK
ncbi:Holliday junction branch migration protein RuvA [Candidatus Dojkabacteria bacterium]|nr:Holliday junction branch migration protein RuvA [Candidatus Dojkabacteria bacterium]